MSHAPEARYDSYFHHWFRLKLDHEPYPKPDVVVIKDKINYLIELWIQFATVAKVKKALKHKNGIQAAAKSQGFHLLDLMATGTTSLCHRSKPLETTRCTRAHQGPEPAKKEKAIVYKLI